MSSDIPRGVLPQIQENELVSLKTMTLVFSILSIVFFSGLLFLAFPIFALIFICETHQTRLIRINSK